MDGHCRVSGRYARRLLRQSQGPTATFPPGRAVIDAPERVVKGDSFLCHPSYCESYRPTARRGIPPDTGSGHVGFRCVRDRVETPPGS